MIGSHRITVSNAKLKYDFTVRRNITMIRGDSATGKTTLVEMIRDYYENGENSGISMNCDKVCRVIGGRDWKALLDTTSDSIVFIDEDNYFLPSEEFARAARDSDNYYVIVSREELPNLPYSVEEIYGIRESGKYGSLKQTYNEMYRIYGTKQPDRLDRPDTIIVEDTNAGFEFYQKSSGISVISANGKSNIFKKMLEIRDEKTLVIADGAAFGPEMNRVMKVIQGKGHIQMFLPESFEWLILCSGLIDGNYVKKVLEDPSEYIDSARYFSWERFFTSLLTEQTAGTYLQYSKSRLNPSYLNKETADRIWAQIPAWDER